MSGIVNQKDKRNQKVNKTQNMPTKESNENKTQAKQQEVLTQTIKFMHWNILASGRMADISSYSA